jgi:rhomboid family GlyGly-CTERM serine protease
MRAALLLAATVPFLALLATTWQDPLSADREAIQGGEFWRLWTGNLVHADLEHLGVAAAAAAVLLAAGRPRPLRLLLLAPLVTAGVLLWRRDLGTFRGLSGVLYGVLAWTALDLARGRPGLARVLSFGLLAVVAGLAAAEVVLGRPPLPAPLALGGVPVPESHLIGIGLGLALGLAARRQEASVATTGA